MAAIAPLRRRWGGLATTDVADDDQLLDLIAASGCRFLLLGFESISDNALHSIGKRFNREQNYRRQIEALHQRNITVQGCFIFGFDSDGQDIFNHTVDRVRDLKVDIPRYSIFTPYPGTRLITRLNREGRILSKNWADYDTMHVVHQPAQMTAEQLYDGFKHAYRQTFKMSHIIRRLPGFKAQSVINLVGNLTYKKFVKRLYHEDRFQKPHGVAKDILQCPA